MIMSIWLIRDILFLVKTEHGKPILSDHIEYVKAVIYILDTFEYIALFSFAYILVLLYMLIFQKHLGTRASFLIPQDIEQRIKHGSAERYNAQYQKFRKLKSDILPLQQLIDTLHKYHRCYDQEGYIENSLTEHQIT